MNNKGIAMIFGFIIIAILTVLASAIISRSINEGSIAKRYLESTQAFWLAEAGVQQAVSVLRNDTNATSFSVNLGSGGYNVSITQEDDFRIVSVNGFVLSGSQINSNRTVEAVLQVTNASQSPESFYDNALYTSGNISVSGDAYNVSGDLLFSGNFSDDDGDPNDDVDGNVTKDPATWPFAEFNFTVLKEESIAQGNYHDNTSLDGPFPEAFWYNESAGIPNIVYLEGDLVLRGNDHVGGVFILEAGEATYDATLRGNAQIDGSIYCRTFTVSGGGNQLNINGGIWAEEIVLHGSAQVTFNDSIMTGVQEYFEEIGSPPLQQMPTNATVISWRDTQNPYSVE